MAAVVPQCPQGSDAPVGFLMGLVEIVSLTGCCRLPTPALRRGLDLMVL